MPEGSGNWAKVCASRAFLLLSNVVGVIEMLFILLSVYEVVNKFGPTCSLYSGHVTLMVIQGIRTSTFIFVNNKPRKQVKVFVYIKGQFEVKIGLFHSFLI